jgi:preprotein translocase subunit SecG
MYTLLVIFHILVCLLLVVTILLQSGKGGGMAGAFGGSSTSMDNYFGAHGAATFLTKATVVLSILFAVLCIVHTFAVRPANQPRSVLEEMAKTQGNSGELPEPTPMSDEAPMPASQPQPAPTPAPAQ